jgi:hypothetical protein
MKRLPTILGTARRLGIAAFACGLIVLACGSAAAATSPIYKCFDRHLALVYTDVPCKDGEQLDVRPGDADPAAMARLDRERDALAQSSARRISDLRAAEVTRNYAAAAPYEYAPAYDAGSYAEPLDYGLYGYGVGYGAYAGAPSNSRHHPRDGRADRRGVRQHVVPSRIPSLSHR